MKKNVVITGGTGLVGKALAELLIRNNYNVIILTRNKNLHSSKINYSYWDVTNHIIDIPVICSANYIIHLAGEGIADKRWTKQRKSDILKSRTEPLKLIFDVLSNNSHQLEALISASGVGYYGAITSNQIFSENDALNKDFLGKTCSLWEEAVHHFSKLNVRTVKLRTGVVLSKKGGALPKMIAPFKLGLGCLLGTGKQYLPWIHLDDLCNLYLFALVNNQFQGAYNAAIEDNTTNEIFSKSVAKILGKMILLPNIPAFVLKILLGEMADIVLYGSRVSNTKIRTTGFKFIFEDLEKCLQLELVE